MEEKIKYICEVCEKDKESTYSNNLEKFLCENCWDEYGEFCNRGL